jgi:hypothetical protein
VSRRADFAEKSTPIAKILQILAPERFSLSAGRRVWQMIGRAAS